MAAKLIAEEGALKGLVLSLDEGDQWVIGRDPDACQLLVEDPSASRKHIVCRNTPNGIVVENLSDTNPAQVNDEEIKQPRLLHDGDSVKIGGGTYRFYSETTTPVFNDNPADSQEEERNGVEGPAVIEPAAEEDNAPEAPAANEAPEEEQVPAAENRPPEQAQIEEGPLTEAEPDKPATATMEQPSAPSEAPPEQPKPEDVQFEEEEARHDTIFEEGDANAEIAEINFDMTDTGRWLLKVIGGPNNGAEFSMQNGTAYLIGTDPNSCDIVFHDTSVSRQHARITIAADDTMFIEDLKSRNGTLVDGEPVKMKQPLATNTLVSMGTTSFIVFDREGEMQTIISPLLPSIVKMLQKEEPKKDEASAPSQSMPQVVKEEPKPEAPPPLPPHEKVHNALGAFILIGIITGMLVIVGVGISGLFRSEPVVITEQVDTTKDLSQAMAPFPSVKYTFNKATGRLMLVGHVLTASDKNQLLYNLQGLNFIKNIDDSGVVIDEYVWQELNPILAKNPNWKGVNIHSPSPGNFVLSGYLQTRKQADQLSDYISGNFPYLDLLHKRIVVEEDVIASVTNALQNHGIKDISVQMNNGELTLTGGVPPAKISDLNQLVNEFKQIPGIRGVKNFVNEMAPEQSMINISDKYEVTGYSHQGAGNVNVVINGRILTRGDGLDGMTITSIKPNVIFLEKDGTKYRIDYNQ